MDLFWSLPDSHDIADLAAPLEQLFKTGRSQAYNSGASMSDPDIAPERAFQCISGRIKVTKLLVSGREILITILQTGSVWSDRAVLNGYWKGVFLEAMEPCQIVSVNAQTFGRAVQWSPELLATFMLQITQQVSDALTLLDDFRGRDIAPRLARVLLRFSKQYGVPTERGVRIDVPFTHQDLANMIGTARETVSRNMALFRQQGLVTDGHAATLEILNLNSLEKLTVS
jgi:CRP-like cAMP-binding protein